MENVNPVIRLLEAEDIPQIAQAFRDLGWNKPASQYQRYLTEQRLNSRLVYVAFIGGKFAGYLTICWRSGYQPFRAEKIPEIVDFNVLPIFRRMGIGTLLMDEAEFEISRVSSLAGIGVGMTADYGAAQKMYILRGYIPDGRGLYWRDHHVRYREEVMADDDLALYFTKVLK